MSWATRTISRQLPGSGKGAEHPRRRLARQLPRGCATVTECPRRSSHSSHAPSRETSRLVEVLSSHSQPRLPNIMNTSSASPSTPNLESLRKVIQEYQPNPNPRNYTGIKHPLDSLVKP